MIRLTYISHRAAFNSNAPLGRWDAAEPPSGDNKLLECRSVPEVLSLPNSEDTLKFNSTERQDTTTWVPNSQKG